MVIKTTPQALKRISFRWLPEEPSENTDTIALNVGGYFMDLRVVKADQSLEWSRAGERKAVAGKDAETYQWTRIIDSLGSTQTDEAAFTVLPNGDDLEAGDFVKDDGTSAAYEEVWRDVSKDDQGSGPSWILRSSDGSTFLGKVGHIFLGMRQDKPENFVVRREDCNESTKGWTMIFDNGGESAKDVPRAEEVLRVLEDPKRDGLAAGDRIEVQNKDYIILGLQ